MLARYPEGDPNPGGPYPFPETEPPKMPEQRVQQEARQLRALIAGEPATVEAGTRAELRLDHCVVAVSDWERSNAFYAAVLGAEVLERGTGFAYRFGDKQLNVHGPGGDPTPVAREPVRPGNSDLCFAWDGPIEEALEHLERHGVAVEEGPVARSGARGSGRSVYFRDPDGSLLELISYASE